MTIIPCDSGSLNHDECSVTYTRHASRKTPTGLRCVHPRGCQMFACCDMLDDCIDMPLNAAAAGEP